MTEREGALEGLAQRLQRACLGGGLTVAVAESCTGGRIAHAITLVPGSSGYFLGGVVSYADQVKRDVLGVPSSVLEQHGAVSAQTAIAMASGVRERLGADLAVSVTGVAGPDGGSAAKPVGLTYVGLADAAGTDVRRFQWDGDRVANIDASAAAALGLLAERAERSVAARGRPAGTEGDR